MARVSDGAPAGLLSNDQNCHCEQCNMLISSMPRESGVIRRSMRVSDGCDDAASAVIPLAVLLRSCAQCALRVEAAAVAVLQALRVVQSLLCEHRFSARGGGRVVRLSNDSSHSTLGTLRRPRAVTHATAHGPGTRSHTADVFLDRL